MQTVLANLIEKADQLKELIGQLMDRSSIHVEPTRSEPRFLLVGGYFWRDLPPEGKQLQSRAWEEYGRYHSITTVLLKDQPEKTLRELKDADHILRAAIQQTGSPRGGTPQAVYQGAVKALDSQVALVGNLYDGSNQVAVYVPDTNALLHHPHLEDWRFPESPQFVVVLLPTVLKELDGLKVNHRNEDVRNKADGLIRRIKGYRARGKLVEGVPLRNGVSTLVARAVEPDVRNSLPWLDPANSDDRILAGFVEVLRQHPHSPVVLMTRDINLQNKAEVAGLVFVEPPDPLPSS